MSAWRRTISQVGWIGFTAVVVSWWLEATIGLVNGRMRTAVVRFMDGPFEVRVFARRRDFWEAELLDERQAGGGVHKIEFAPDPFLRSLIECSGDVLEQCSKNGWRSGDVESIISQRERLIHYGAKNRRRW